MSNTKNIIIALVIFTASCFGNIYNIKLLTDGSRIDESGFTSFTKTNCEMQISCKKNNGVIEIELLTIKASREHDPNHPSWEYSKQLLNILNNGQKMSLKGSIVLDLVTKEGVLVIPERDLEINFKNYQDLQKTFIENEKIESTDELVSKLSPELIAASILITDVPLILEIPGDIANRSIRSLVEKKYPFVGSNQLRWGRGQSFDVERIGYKTLLKFQETTNLGEIFGYGSGSEKNDMSFLFDERNELKSARIVRHHSQPEQNMQSESSIEITRVDSDLRDK